MLQLSTGCTTFTIDDLLNVASVFSSLIDDHQRMVEACLNGSHQRAFDQRGVTNQAGRLHGRRQEIQRQFGAQDCAAEIDQHQDACWRPTALNDRGNLRGICSQNSLTTVVIDDASRHFNHNLPVSHLICQLFDPRASVSEWETTTKLTLLIAQPMSLLNPAQGAFDGFFPVPVAGLTFTFIQLRLPLAINLPVPAQGFQIIPETNR